MNNNKRLALFILPIIFAVLAGCGEKEKMRVYRNADFNFSITYPSGYQAKEIGSTGVILQGKQGAITIQAMLAGTMYEKMPFDRYARIAASVEIQGFEKLISFESFVSDYGIRGYKTYWEVVRHEDTDTGEVNTVDTVGPIFYFPQKQKRKQGGQPVKTIMISCDPAVQKDAEVVAASFRYLNTFMRLFGEVHTGKIYFVKKAQPFRIELPANPTAGYNWYVADMDENYFKIRGSGYNARKNGRLGSGGTSYWMLTPLKEGFSSIRLLYYRPWEGKDKAVDEYRIRFIITNNSKKEAK
jgi:inhibitor of cysteine peptidase